MNWLLLVCSLLMPAVSFAESTMTAKLTWRDNANNEGGSGRTPDEHCGQYICNAGEPPRRHTKEGLHG